MIHRFRRPDGRLEDPRSLPVAPRSAVTNWTAFISLICLSMLIRCSPIRGPAVDTRFREAGESCFYGQRGQPLLLRQSRVMVIFGRTREVLVSRLLSGFNLRSFHCSTRSLIVGLQTLVGKCKSIVTRAVMYSAMISSWNSRD